MAGLFKKILKGILIGGGTILSLLCPPIGGAVITAGMKIGAGAVAVGSLIKTSSSDTVDTTTSTITDTLQSLGLLKPSGYSTVSGSGYGLVLTPAVIIIGALVLGLLIFKKRR